MHQISRVSRRLIARLEAGEDVIDALDELCGDAGAAEARIGGALSAATLLWFDAADRTYKERELSGPLEIVSARAILGRAAGAPVWRLEATLLVAGPLGPQLVGGTIARCEVLGAEAIVDLFEDVVIERGRDQASGRMATLSVRSLTPSAEAEAEAVRPAKMSWAEASKQATEPEAPKPEKATRAAHQSEPAPSASSAASEATEDAPQMRPGDILNHPKLGRCRVLRVEEDEYAHIRLPRGKISKLVLDIFDVVYDGPEDGKNAFSLKIRR